MSHLNLLNVDPSSQRAACEPAAIDRRMAGISPTLFIVRSGAAQPPPPPQRASCVLTAAPAAGPPTEPRLHAMARGGFAFVAGAPTLSRDSRPGYTSGLRWVQYRRAARTLCSAARGHRAGSVFFFLPKIKSKSNQNQNQNQMRRANVRVVSAHTKKEKRRDRVQSDVGIPRSRARIFCWC